MYTLFWDMYSGCDQKLDNDYIIIEGDKKTAIWVFIEKFGFHPPNITCQCCGEDYDITEFETRDEALEYLPHYVNKSDIYPFSCEATDEFETAYNEYLERVESCG